MGQQPSMNNKRSDAELLYEVVRTGSVEAIRALHKKGVSLEVVKNKHFILMGLHKFLFIYFKIFLLFTVVCFEWYCVLLQWTDQEGKTPLILACMDLSLVHVAKGLIELGANVNAYRRGKSVFWESHNVMIFQTSSQYNCNIIWYNLRLILIHF